MLSRLLAFVAPASAPHCRRGHLVAALGWSCCILFAPAPKTLAQAAPGERALPESQAGDAHPAVDYASEFSAILSEIVTPEGFVRYHFLSTRLKNRFMDVLKAIEDFEAHSLRSDRERMAFWMNAYNVLMLKNIIEHPDAVNIMEGGYVAAFFKTPFRVARHAVTLDQIEHVILRKESGPRRLEALSVTNVDPRLHVGINCAAVSCPGLRPRAFTSSNVDEELNRAMRDFTRLDRHIRVDDDKFVLTSIIDWFGTDFEGSGRPIGDVLLEYMPKDRPDYGALRRFLKGRTVAVLQSDPRVRFEYDWTINRAGAER